MTHPWTEKLESDYQLLRRSVARLDRSDRALIEIGGADRAAWLHNLVTNVVKTLKASDGNYGFAINVKGRTIFDLNYYMLHDPDKKDGLIWIDVDRSRFDTALKHFNRYTITEDVTIRDISDDWSRIALSGFGVHDAASKLGCANLSVMPDLQHHEIKLDAVDCRIVRHDMLGVPGAEIFVPSARLSQAESFIEITCGAIPTVEAAAAEAVRLEMGVPSSRSDIDEEVVPPETLQIERGISYHKGCYLGQEVIERMRSHGVLPRKLVVLSVASSEIPQPPLKIADGDNDVGRITSSGWSPALQSPLCMGYARSAVAVAGKALSIRVGENLIATQVIAVPVKN